MAFVPADFWPPGPPTGGAALDQTARDAAAAAQVTANAAVSTGPELAALVSGDPAAAAAVRLSADRDLLVSSLTASGGAGEFNGQLVKASGYAVRGDGGGGLFWWDAPSAVA